MSKLAHSNDETMAQIEASNDADGRDEFTGHVAACEWVKNYGPCTCAPKGPTP